MAQPDTIVVVLYLVFGAGYHAINKRSYRNHHWALPAHALAGIFELVLFYLHDKMTEVAFVLCLIQSGTNLALAKSLRKGIPSLTRTAYQAGGIFRPIMSLIAFRSGLPFDYHDSIMPLHSFVYARLLLLCYSTISPAPHFEDNINSKQVYNLAICASALIAIGQTHRGISAIIAYLLVVHAIGKISLWTRAQLAVQSDDITWRLVVAQFFSYIGFRTPIKDRLDPDASLVANGPVIGRLPGDALGHWWNAVGRGTCEYAKRGELMGMPDSPPETPALADKYVEAEWVTPDGLSCML